MDLSFLELMQMGGVLVVALALVEAMKVIVIKSLNGRASSITQTGDGFAKEVAWRVEVGAIVKEQHEIQKDMRSLLGAHHEASLITRRIAEDIHKDVRDIHDDVRHVKDRIDKRIQNDERRGYQGN